MNFVFKSTFTRQSKMAVPGLLANILSLSMITILYLTNYILPAAIDSRPHGTTILYISATCMVIQSLSILITLFKLITKSTHMYPFGKFITRKYAQIQRYPYLQIPIPLLFWKQIIQLNKSPKQ